MASLRSSFRGRTPSCEALKGAFTDLYRLDDFESEKLGAGFFSEVFKVRHISSGRVMVLKMNKQQSNTLNMRKEIQLMNKLSHPNILKFEAVCIHGGQLHALTEYIDGGTLEDLAQNTAVQLPWSIRTELGLHITQGLEYLHGQVVFHRDLTSKNVFIRNNSHKCFTAIIGDFGLATRIPKKTDPRLPQVGSPYWMSPECLKGEYYDQQADIFSFGIIMCELIARVSADPDYLPRTQNFGVEYKAFSGLCPQCPPEFLKTTFTCVSIDPNTRPSAASLVTEFSHLHKVQRLKEEEETERQRASIKRRAEALSSSNTNPVLKRFFSQDAVMVGRKSPSEKARVHQRSCSKELPLETAETVCEEMCLLDPYYQPPSPDQQHFLNPFATLPRLRKGRKIIGSICDNFSSCFEVPSPQVTSPSRVSSVINSQKQRTKSLPNSPTVPLSLLDPSVLLPRIPSIIAETGGHDTRPHHSTSQDDSYIGTWSGLTPVDFPLRRAGSLESGFYSSSNTDWMSEEGLLSNRSVGSSLLTVSDLEEDLRAASAFLSNKRTSSVFTDSLDDLSSGLDDISSGFPLRKLNFEGIKNEKYEKDIREIVEYFEKKCAVTNKKGGSQTEEKRSSPEIARSQKIESLIKKVAENKTRARLTSRYPGNHQQQNLQVCLEQQLNKNNICLILGL